MQREETRTITTCDFCKKEIVGGEMDSVYTSFTRPDLDSFHGIWLGDVHEMYVGQGSGPERHFCDIECLFKDIRRFHDQMLLKNGNHKELVFTCPRFHTTLTKGGK